MPITFDHQWSAWVDPAYPVRSSSLFEWSDVDLIVAHYTAADNLIDGDPGEYASQLPQYLRNIQRYYLGKGYSIGYNAAIDWLGGRWKLRGEVYECAANIKVNSHAFAVLCLVDGDDELTVPAVRSFRRIVAEARVVCPNKLTVVGHGETDSTGCPGGGIQRQINAGILDPARTPDWGVADPKPTREPTLRVAYRVWLKANRRKAVERCQRAIKVTVDGDYGPVTGEKMRGLKRFFGAGEDNTDCGVGGWRVVRFLEASAR